MNPCRVSRTFQQARIVFYCYTSAHADTRARMIAGRLAGCVSACMLVAFVHTQHICCVSVCVYFSSVSRKLNFNCLSICEKVLLHA